MTYNYLQSNHVSAHPLQGLFLRDLFRAFFPIDLELLIIKKLKLPVSGIFAKESPLKTISHFLFLTSTSL
jgi:hypothetical protein